MRDVEHETQGLAGAEEKGVSVKDAGAFHGRDVHEKGKTSAPARPVERVIVKEIAEIAARGA